jgi:DNA-binding NtrC family response regulator
MAKRILSVSYDAALLRSREMILQRQGYEVVSVQSLQDAILHCRQEVFDVALIGHAIPIAEQTSIADELRKNCPGAKVVALTARPMMSAPYADRSVDAMRPDELVAELRHLFAEADSSKAEV